MSSLTFAMKRSFFPVIVLASLMLLGASCNLKPLEPAPETETETVKPPKPVVEEPKEEPKDEEPAPTEEEPAEETPAEEPKEEPVVQVPDPSKGTGYGGKVIGELTMKPDANSVIVFLTAEKPDYKGKDAYMEFGCESLLVPVRREVTKTQSDLAEALVQLITIKETAYFDQGIRNAVAPSAPKIRLTNIHYEGKTRVIDFDGQFISAGTCDDPRIKAQIEETVKLYATDYQIRINGKESEWRCLFDQSGLCA